ncbi:MAG: hypothetical protein ACJ761_03420 [Chloroflexota bacterium]
MAVRLQMKLGVVAEHDRIADSPDTVVVVEPSVGSVARSKGHLYLLVTSRLSTRHAFEATRLTAETIRNEYYYDESAGIRVCLQKAIATANKRLAHQADRLGLKPTETNGPIGVGVAVVRGNEMYVATVGPAEAYLIRQARLSTLPDPHRERGLPSPALEPDVWRGEINVGDSLVLVSPNVVAKLGADELKDAMLTLHPQSAMEHLHHRFVAASGSGSDGAIAFEATEVSSTARQRTLVPVRPPEPLAGTADRSPIPLADNVQAAGIAVTAAAEGARTAAGGALERLVLRVQDLLPHRRPAYRRVTPLATRRETQRRAAVALIAFLVVVGGLGLAVYAFGGQSGQAAIPSIRAGEAALQSARANLAKVKGPGIDLVRDDPSQALRLLTEAYRDLQVADGANISAAVVAPLRQQAVEGLDRLYKVVPVSSSPLYTFQPARGGKPVDLESVVQGPDGNAYVLDRATDAVYRVDLKTRKATTVLRAGTRANGATAAAPRIIAVGGPDLLILDAKNVLWRWRPANNQGRGTLTRIRVNGAASWGDDIRAIGTYLRNADAGLYNLYVVDPSEQQILAYSPAADGSGFPARPTGRLATARKIDGIASMYIDGDIFVAEDGKLERIVAGKSEGWEAKPPAGPGSQPETLRPAPSYTMLTGGGDRRLGKVYAYDPANARIVAVDKANGAYLGQFRLAGGAGAWKDLRGFYVVPGSGDGPDTLTWITAAGLFQSRLEAVTDTPGANPSAAPSRGPSPRPSKTTNPKP